MEAISNVQWTVNLYLFSFDFEVNLFVIQLSCVFCFIYILGSIYLHKPTVIRLTSHSTVASFYSSWIVNNSFLRTFLLCPKGFQAPYGHFHVNFIRFILDRLINTYHVCLWFVSTTKYIYWTILIDQRSWTLFSFLRENSFMIYASFSKSLYCMNSFR